MPSNWQETMAWSNQAFVVLVWDKISTWCGGGKLVPVETNTADFLAHSLDTLAGIDAWQVIQYTGVRGIASRVQRGAKWWPTFTIRFRRASGQPTEYHKRLRALKNHDFVYPYFTVQAYITPDAHTLLACAVTTTTKLYALAESPVCQIQTNPQDGTQFKCIRWQDLGADVFVYKLAPVVTQPQTRLW